MIDGKKIFVIMPAYRAAAKIKSVFRRIDNPTLEIIDHFVIVVDGDEDGTLQKGEELLTRIGNGFLYLSAITLRRSVRA